MDIDAIAFYTYFTNKITANLDADHDKIIYENPDGFAVSRAGSGVRYSLK